MSRAKGLKKSLGILKLWHKGINSNILTVVLFNLIIKGIDGTTSSHIKGTPCDVDQYRMTGAKCARERASSGTPSFCATLTERSCSR